MCAVSDDTTRRLLPESMKQLASHIGLDATLAIAELRGGVRLCVPRVASPEHWLVEHIGLKALQRLVTAYAGEEIEVPVCAALKRAMRDQRLARDRRGASVAELAKRYGMTERGVRAALKRVHRSEAAALGRSAPRVGRAPTPTLSALTHATEPRQEPVAPSPPLATPAGRSRR